MGGSMNSWVRNSVWALVPNSPFEGGATELFATAADSERARKFANGGGRIEEVAVRSVELGGGPF